MSDAPDVPTARGAPPAEVRTRGMVLGKFLPPHLGHIYLCETAERLVDELTIVVGTLAAEPIPGALRHAWMTELFPRSRVVHLTDENPQDPSEHPDFWRIWRTSLERILPVRPDVVFASERYGHRLAAELGARFVPIDVARSALPVSGTAVRADPLRYFDHLPRCVRPYYLRRVVVFGPESSGKSTLAAHLAQRHDTCWVPEYARTWLEAFDRTAVAADMPRIARGQAASEDALARSARRVLVADTDPLLTTVWSEVLFGAVDPEVKRLAESRAPHLYLLTDPEVPWVEDPVRYQPSLDARRDFFARCQALLERLGRPYTIVRGSWEERTRTAEAAVDALLARPHA